MFEEVIFAKEYAKKPKSEYKNEILINKIE
jgi:hypothetical protein